MDLLNVLLVFPLVFAFKRDGLQHRAPVVQEEFLLYDELQVLPPALPGDVSPDV